MKFSGGQSLGVPLSIKTRVGGQGYRSDYQQRRERSVGSETLRVLKKDKERIDEWVERELTKRRNK